MTRLGTIATLAILGLLLGQVSKPKPERPKRIVSPPPAIPRPIPIVCYINKKGMIVCAPAGGIIEI